MAYEGLSIVVSATSGQYWGLALTIPKSHIAVMVKALTDGSKAIGFFNREQGIVTAQIRFRESGCFTSRVW